MKFPEKIYVVREEDGGDVYYTSQELPENFDDGSIVAVYEFVSAGKLKVEVNAMLVPIKQAKRKK